ncbi:urease accessory protein UreF [Sulfitobacter pseudonitzschiae]|uniref:Urease accessory protein UreF n=1 Tax=Pseudosulfitobacter pseudonitzschiae TaxID=1402135 RepID=A0A9Q2NSB2_9RHOB|nr:urease accessory UreF family protein [Pseudosulfitobacter pseudonitzschiae]MBM2293485.1 urease accessory protein UreF [Pseudosulfitobacter pseudonitzschiae]MBM2298299.1 urease accessory protein UreF [Pseudosulfitobacter pseudonitzschiae]MBM2303212.1 urease accessory protein UreF [Pseudosulfitobacter pseudonitzschiae]MBM2312996.1 urease accessory protein UreF [Pseudosulfitobacter pseudonitzschiae]MBM2317909.1 urease accessory protein UreF [Pseudosulfitobacter pseudonitzschiae]
MPIDAAVLTLAQWFSPSFPVGAFAYSHGLEWAVQAGDVTDAAQTQHWIDTVLRHGAGWNDCLFIAAAYRTDDAGAVDAMARAFAASAERLRETDLQGAAFAAAVANLNGTTATPRTYPVAVGEAARNADLPLELTAKMYLHSLTSSLAGAAMRLVPLGQSDGQAIIRALTPAAQEIATRACAASLDDLSATAFATDIASMKHETQYSRIFRT